MNYTNAEPLQTYDNASENVAHPTIKQYTVAIGFTEPTTFPTHAYQQNVSDSRYFDTMRRPYNSPIAKQV